MNRGFVLNITDNDAEIVLDNESHYIVPLSMLPFGIHIDDFIIIENGKTIIDPDTDSYQESIMNEILKK